MRHLTITLLLTLAACNNQSKQQLPTEATVDQEQLMAFALAEGNRISNQAQMALGGQLKKAISEGGPSHAVGFCNLSATKILDTITTGYSQLEVGCTSLKVRNQNNTPSKVEHQLLDDYRQKSQDKSDLSPQVQPIGNNSLLYGKPIMLNNPLCLNCHGTVGTQISDETYQVIREHYPQDQAIDFEMGDLRGMWTIEFNREELTEMFLAQTDSKQ